MREALSALPQDFPLHIHIAEQIGEVQDSLAIRGARPVEWLLHNVDIGTRWTLVHATHLTEQEVRGIAKSGATVAICPTTEANLGDGLFPLRAYLDAGGAWGIGSDSHISVSPVEELRWLEYGQRLITRRRNIAVSGRSTSVGETLLQGVMDSRANATGFGAESEDFLILDEEAPAFAGAQPENIIDRWIFNGNQPLVREVHVGGKQVVAEGRHRDRDAIATRYRETLRALLTDT
jgi:formimidoylglutamate deiminase